MIMTTCYSFEEGEESMKTQLTAGVSSTPNGDYQAKKPKKGEWICQKLIFQGELYVEGCGPYSTLRLLV